MLAAIIVAGGSSRRMGFDKTFALLEGKPIIAHSVATFEAADCVTDIIIVGREDRLQEIRAACAAQGSRKLRAVIRGGAHRQDSVAEGLKQLSTSTDFA